jgi:hypothetical protein
VVDPEDTILRVLAALKGVYGQVGHVVVVVAVYLVGGERSARTADDLVTETFVLNRFIGIGELYGLKGCLLTAGLAICGRQLAVLGPLILGPMLLALCAVGQHPGTSRGQRRRPRAEEGEEPPSDQPARRGFYGMIALLSFCVGRSACASRTIPFRSFPTCSKY